MYKTLFLVVVIVAFWFASRPLVVLLFRFCVDLIDVKIIKDGVIRRNVGQQKVIFLPCTEEAKLVLNRHCYPSKKWWLGGKIVSRGDAHRMYKLIRDDSVSPQRMTNLIKL
jgi:hypothetical protein